MGCKEELAKINVLGFDLGHGETALTYILGCKDKRMDPQTVFNPPSDITAVSYLPTSCGEKDIIWGRRAIIDPRAQSEVFDIGFKGKPGKNSEQDKRISDFACAVYQDATERTPQIKEEEDCVECFIGCPTAWEEDDKETYSQLFTKAGLPNPTIIPESDAAFAYFFELIKDKEEYDEISLAEFKKPILLLDFGSSTLDVTLVRGRESEAISDGIPLGASLIDKAILEWNLKHCLDNNYWATLKFKRSKRGGYEDYSESIGSLKNSLKKSPSAYARAELLCRDAKEKYFSGSARIEGYVVKEREDFGDEELYIFINDDQMNHILNTPLEQVIPAIQDMDPEIRRELAGHSWMGRCRKFVTDDLNKQLRERGLTIGDIGRVILTGGASLMPPIRDLAKEIFPESNYVFDSEPSLCIAKGLACRGKIDIQTRSFEEKVDAFCEDTDKGLLAIVEKHYGSIKLADILGDKISQITGKNLRKWQERVIEADQIAYWIKKEIQEWVHAEEGFQNETRKEMTRIEAAIRKEVNQELKPICEKYGLNIEFLTESFLEKDLLKSLLDFAELDDFSDSELPTDSFNFVSVLQEFVKFLTGEEVLGAMDDQFFSELGGGFGWIRRMRFSDSNIAELCDAVNGMVQLALISFLGDDDIVKLLIMSIYMPLQATMRRKINAAKYLLACL